MAIWSNRESVIINQALVILIGGLLIVAGYVFNPEVLIDLGPFQKSLLHPDESVRQFAAIEILILRYAVGIFGVVLVLSAVFWNRIAEMSVVTALQGYTPVSERPMRIALTVRDMLFPCVIVAVLLAWSLIAILQASTQFSADFGWIDIVGQEDGIVESITALLFVATSFYAYKASICAELRLRKIVLAILSAGFLLCMLEEISWGQRIFNWESSSWMNTHNVQGETNLHNLFGYACDHLFIAGIFVWGAIFPVACRFSGLFHKTMDRLGVPIASLNLAFGFFFVSLIHSWTVYQVIPEIDVRPAEIREMLSAFGLTLMLAQTFYAEKAAAVTRNLSYRSMGTGYNHEDDLATSRDTDITTG